MEDRSVTFLTLVTVFYALSGAATSIFLPNYFLQTGLSMNQVILLFASLFVTLGIVPILTLKFLPKVFERLLILGIVLQALFYFLLIFVNNPILLGLVYGLALATFFPSYNLLIYRFTNIKKRGLMVGLFYVAIPNIAGVFGPFLGGVFINFFKFGSLFTLAILLLILAFIFSLKIRYEPVAEGFSIPRNALLLLFGLIVFFVGFSEPQWISYPLFLNHLTGGFLQMGVVAAVLWFIFAIIAVIVGKISEVEKHRIDFAFLGMLLLAVWSMALAFVQNVPQLIAASVLFGLSGAFGALVFSLYGDFFERKYHATLVALWEAFLMVGRLASLIPATLFLTSFDFGSYFSVIGVVTFVGVIILFLILRFMYRSKKIAFDVKQK